MSTLSTKRRVTGAAVISGGFPDLAFEFHPSASLLLHDLLAFDLSVYLALIFNIDLYCTKVNGATNCVSFINHRT